MPAKKKKAKKSVRKKPAKKAPPIVLPEVLGEVPTVTNQEPSQEELAAESMKQETLPDNFQVPSTNLPPQTPKDSSRGSVQTQQETITSGSTPQTTLRPMSPVETLAETGKTMDVGGMASFIEYVQTSWLRHAIAMHVRLISMQCPEALPASITWRVPQNIDVPDLVRKKMADPNYLMSIYPLLTMLMGSNIQNKEWTTAVATTITLFRVLDELTELAIHLATEGEMGTVS